jgi:predicted RNase H-like HicB family nuclease
MKNIVQFLVSKGIDGYFVASAASFPIVTQGKTLDELMNNVVEATELYFEVAGREEKAEFTKTPSVLMNYEIPLQLYA